jgi:hypothetical protein
MSRQAIVYLVLFVVIALLAGLGGACATALVGEGGVFANVLAVVLPVVFLLVGMFVVVFVVVLQRRGGKGVKQ